MTYNNEADQNIRLVQEYQPENEKEANNATVLIGNESDSNLLEICDDKQEEEDKISETSCDTRQQLDSPKHQARLCDDFCL